jgi:uncharacterized repeat protein (TIGR04076 family)
MPVLITIKSGRCSDGVHEVGQTYTVGSTTPGGMCSDAWLAIAPYVMTLLRGGDFPWSKKKGCVTVHCPDPGGITIELQRVEAKE